MRQFLFIIGALFSLALPVGAQNISRYFEVIPDEHLIQVDINRRKDMIDLKQAGREAVVQNKLGGTSELLELTDNYLKLRVSESSTLEMKLLPGPENEDVIGLIKTTCAPACDSEILFYNTSWQRIPVQDLLTKPVRADFFVERTAANKELFDVAFQSADMDLIRYSFLPDSNDLLAEYSLEEHVPAEIYKEMQPFLKKTPLRYEWKDKKYHIQP